MVAIRKKEDNWVNLIKLFCVFIVVFGHYNYTDWAGTKWLLYIVKSAVSVMFIYSGYYLSKNKVLDDFDKTQKYLKHLVIMTVVWLLIYFVRDVIQGEHTLESVEQIFQDTMFNFVQFNSGHIWYIQNLFLAVALMFVFRKKHFGIGEIILLIAAQKCYYWLLICALASIGIGCLLAEIEHKFDRTCCFACLGTGIAAIAVMCGFSYGWIGTRYVLGGDIMIEIMRYAASVSVAVVGLCLDTMIPLNMSVIGHYIRKLSTVVYLCHTLFIQYTFQVASSHGALWGEKKFFIYSAGTGMLLSIITGIVLIIVSEIKPFRWLKKIY